MTGRLETQAAEIGALRTELGGIRGELGDSGAMLARCIAALEGAGLLGDVAGDEAHRSDRRATGTDT
jgi:hypothetical protein